RRCKRALPWDRSGRIYQYRWRELLADSRHGFAERTSHEDSRLWQQCSATQAVARLHVWAWPLAVRAPAAAARRLCSSCKCSSFPSNLSGSGGKLVVALAMLLALRIATRFDVLRRPGRAFALSSILGAIMLVPGCGGGAGTTTTTTTPSQIISSGTPAGTYSVTVTASSGNRSTATVLTLKIN